LMRPPVTARRPAAGECMSPLIELVETLGDPYARVAGGVVIGALFGFFAQRSRFCLRAAVIEAARGHLGCRLAVWLFAFSAAVVGAQLLALLGRFDTTDVRQLASRGSLSGALIGGLMFGAGMILARGCSSRLLVLAANGNLRALLSGLIFAVTAQASMGGVLAPGRETLGNLWTIDGGHARDLLALTGMGNDGGLVFGLIWLAAGMFFALRARIPLWGWVGGIGCGVMVAAAWWYNFALSQITFEPTAVKSLSFTGPAADMLMLVLSPLGQPLNFDHGMVPGVFIGSFAAAWFARE